MKVIPPCCVFCDQNLTCESPCNLIGIANPVPGHEDIGRIMPCRERFYNLKPASYQAGAESLKP